MLLLPLGARAQVTIDADYFTRGEVRRGGISKSSEDVDKNYGFDHANFIVERTKLSLDYAADNIQGRLTAQHSGTWGSKEGGDFNVHEAWMKFVSDKGFFAQIGRQNLSYDDQRIFGSDDWSMTGITHDVLKLGFEGHGHRLHIFAGYNQNPENIRKAHSIPAVFSPTRPSKRRGTTGTSHAPTSGFRCSSPTSACKAERKVRRTNTPCQGCAASKSTARS